MLYMPNHHLQNQVHNDFSVKEKNIYLSEIKAKVTHFQLSNLYGTFLPPKESMDYIYMYMYSCTHTPYVILKWKTLV